jgi:hypothetical protein
MNPMPWAMDFPKYYLKLQKEFTDRTYILVLFGRWVRVRGQDWNLNSGLCTCKAGTLPLEPYLQFILL